MDTTQSLRKPVENELELSPEDWQARVDSLQTLVCLLLEKNQAMRMASFFEEGKPVKI